MIEKFYTLAQKTETGAYAPVQCVNGDSARIPVTLDETIARKTIMNYLDPEKRLQLEGVVLDITTYVIRGVIPRDRLMVLN